MGTTADKLSYLNDTKEALKTSINNFDDSVASISDETTFRDYAAKVDANNTVVDNALSDADNVLSDIIGGTTESPTAKEKIVDAINNRGGVIETANTWSECADEIKYMDAEWAPDRLWPDLQEILDNDPDADNYIGNRWVGLFYGFDSEEVFKLDSINNIRIRTSDGTVYSYESDGETVTHIWMHDPEMIDSNGNQLRWVIYYNSGGTAFEIRRMYAKPITLLFQSNLSPGYGYDTGVVPDNPFIFNNNFQSFNFCEGYGFSNPNLFNSSFLSYCPSFSKLPDVSFPTECTYSKFLMGASRIHEINFDIIASSADCLFAYPDSVPNYTIKRVRNIYYGTSRVRLGVCYGLNYAGILDFSDVSSVAKPYFNLIKASIKLPTLSMDWSYSTNLDIESLTYMCDNAPDVTLVDPAPTLTLGTTLQTRAGQDNLDKLIAKGWTIA